MNLDAPNGTDAPVSAVASRRRAGPSQGSRSRTADIRVLFDGECPLCKREIEMLRRRDGGRGRIDFEDIAAPDFDAARYGTTLHDLMARIHGVLPDGTLVEGVEVFRRAYTAVGLGWLVAPTRWPLLRPAFDAAQGRANGAVKKTMMLRIKQALKK